MAVNGIELQVGQEWRCADGAIVCIDRKDIRDDHAPWVSSRSYWLDDTGHPVGLSGTTDDLVELLSGPGFVAPAPEGFTPWAGGEQPAETVGKRVHAHFRNTEATTGAYLADDFSWKNTNSEDDIVAYKVVEDKPRPGVIDDYTKPDTREYTGGSVNYYTVEVTKPTTAELPYTAECNDIIEALQMNYAEGNAFKAIWRSCAARLGISKRGYTDGLYDAEKVVFYGQRMVVQQKGGV